MKKIRVIKCFCVLIMCALLVMSDKSILALAQEDTGEDAANQNTDDTEKEPVVDFLNFKMPKIKDSKEQKFGFKEVDDIEAQAAIVVDVKTGYTLYEKNIYKKMYPASITKTMTCLLSIENLNLDDNITYSYDAVYGIEAGSSSAYMSEGETITVEQSLYGLMLISGNDLANGLAESVSGTQSEFAELMSAKARQLGCKNTHFMNPHGLHDENHYTCPYDMALMAKYAYDNMPFYRTLISTLHYTVEPTSYYPEQRYWTNTNKLINPEEPEFYDEDCLGGKTGYTDQARNTLVSFHDVDGRTLLIVVMKCPGYQYAYSDTKLLCNYMREHTSAAFWADIDESYDKENAKKNDNKQISSQSLVASSKNVSAEKDEKKGSFIPAILIGSFVCAIGLVAFDLYTTAKKRGIIDRRRRRRRKYRNRRK